MAKTIEIRLLLLGISSFKKSSRTFDADHDFKWDDGVKLNEIVHWCAGEYWYPFKNPHIIKKYINIVLKYLL